MSLGFKGEPKKVEDALLDANKLEPQNILVFSSMNNEGNHSKARWPARNKDLAIGIHGSRPDGVEACSFAGLPVAGNPNFMVRGEDIQTQLPEGFFQIAQGSSYATPIAASMAALILQFAYQQRVTWQTERVAVRGKEKLHEKEVMIQVLKAVSNKSRDGNFRWIHPKLLWKDLPPDTVAGGRVAYEFARAVIERATR